MRRAARPAQSLESDHQIALFEWAAMVPLPELRLLYANANGGARHKATAGRLKAEGVKPGVPDLCLPVARHGYHGLYIELKRPKEGPGTRAGKTSDDQDAWIAALTAEGYRAVVCYGWVEASEEIMRYLGRRVVPASPDGADALALMLSGCSPITAPPADRRPQAPSSKSRAADS